MNRYGLFIAALLGSVLAPPANAGITLCNQGKTTLSYVMIRNYWGVGANFMPVESWSVEGWHRLPPGCSTVIDAQQLLHAFFLIQEPLGKRWRTLKYSINDPGYGQGSSGTDQQFCVSDDKMQRHTQTLEELAVCPKGQRLETFSVYVKSFADTNFTVKLD